MKKILGLDLGTNSIGWALIEQDIKNQNGKILGAGSRIIPMSQDVLGKFDSGQTVSQTAERTGFRGVRRLRERHLLRRERLHRVLNILNFLPAHYKSQIDFDKRPGQFLPEKEPKLPYSLNPVTGENEFIFKKSFFEMMKDMGESNPQMIENKKRVPYDWTIYYLRKKALTEKVEKEELAWILLNFNQKRGYYQIRGEEDEEHKNKSVEYHSLMVTNVEDSGDRKGKDEVWYNVHLENGWIYRRTSKNPLDWIGKTKEFIVTTELNEDGTVKTDKEGKEKRTFRAPSENDWNLLKKKTEHEIALSNKTVGAYIYDSLLINPKQKIKGKLVRVIERRFYKNELESILKEQLKHHPEFTDKQTYSNCISELYPNNDSHRELLYKKDFVHLFLDDIIFYQRPLKSKKSLISNCKFEKRVFQKNGIETSEPLKCIAKSHPLYQEFRLWQFVHNLRIFQKEKLVNGKLEADVDVTAQFLTSEEDWASLYEWLSSKKEISQKSFFKYPKFKLKKEADKYRWNYVEDKTYPCNETGYQIASRISNVEGLSAGFLTKEKEEALWHILYSIDDKEEITKALNKFASKYSLGADFVESFKKFPPFKKEYGSFSAKAIKKLLPIMKMGKYWNKESIDKKSLQRINKIIDGEYDEEIQRRVREKAIALKDLNNFKGLPLWLSSYIIYDRHSESEDIQYWKTPEEITLLEQHSLRNPIVEQIINETLSVVKDIWKYYGKGCENFFDEIHIELSREMKNPAEKRKQITSKISDNENTNIRVKALLMELMKDKEIENVRPYSPSQQEILKLYEEGALNSQENIPDDILKISRQAQPTSSELTKYKLWLEQKYRSPYTGDIIPLGKLFTNAYEIEHVIPQSRFFDDSLSNKVICETEVNKEKDRSTGFEYIKNNQGKKVELSFGKTATIFTLSEYQDFIKRYYSKNALKMKKLLMEDIPEEFIQRQLNDSRYISKVVKNLVSNIVRTKDEQDSTSKNVIVTNGSITTSLKQDWGLNDIWNDIITPRFERLNEITKTNDFGSWISKEGKRVFQPKVPLNLQKGFSKKRIDHRHHALDAIVIACTTRDHVNYLNNISALSKDKREKAQKRHDLKNKLCYKKYSGGDSENYNWTFKKPWDSFSHDTKSVLKSIIVSFKKNQRIINKTNNYYQKWSNTADGKLTKEYTKQTKGENWAIRKPMHKETVSGIVKLKFNKKVSLSNALNDFESINDKSLKNKIKELKALNYDKKKILKYFKEKEFKWQEKDVSQIEVSYWVKDNVATRVKVDESFKSSKIQNITDSGIRRIMTRHLEKYNEYKNGSIIEHPELAFSPDGLDKLNENILELNGGKKHQPIYKVRVFEPKGNKFQVGGTGNKTKKYVETAKGTNLYFAIYTNDEDNRSFETIPLNVVIERQKQKCFPVPEINSNGDRLLFYISPNDLIYVPECDKEGNVTENISNWTNKEEQIRGERIYKMVSCTEKECHFTPHYIAKPIVETVELGSNNKSERCWQKEVYNKKKGTLDGEMIKKVCIKLEVDRLGNLRPYETKRL